MRAKKFLLIFIVIGILLMLNEFGGGKLKNIFYLVNSPFSKIFWLSGERISNFFDTLSEIKNLKEEKENLQKENYLLLHQLTQCQELKKENEFLKKALNLSLEKKFNLSLVEVLAKEVDDEVILISGGQEEGISKNMPVITEEGVLVGKVKASFPNFAKVELISAKESRFEIEIVGKENALGMAQGRGGSQLEFQLIPREVQIEKGDIVQTTSLRGNFPKGLLIGEIEKIQKSDVEPYQKGTVIPYFLKSKMRFLLVIKRPYF